ncbi:MAG: efflux RND transporter periplasmic adaptor subunit [Methylococcaceae bacterium]|nr:efflux RND transporter periplasmic adaptor subunit [Methylococcaceae bacterium]MDP3904175.1 efflux RND transporter periplasmic adaptor subunit [Methylococcaceae bacterium]
MMTENRLKIGSALLLLLLGIGGAGAIIALRPQVVTQTPKADVPEVSVIQVEPQSITLSVHSQGIVTPRNEIDLVPEVAGKVIYLHADFVAGGFFKRDELLVTIDPRDYDVAIAEVQAQIAEAKRFVAMEEAQADQAHNEWQALGDGEPSALAMREPQLAEARAKLKSAEANLALANVKRSRCELRAPFTGRLQSKTIGLGQFIQPGDKIARIFSTDVAEIRLPLSTAQLSFLDLPLGTAYKGPSVSLSAQFAGTLHTWQGRIVRTEGSLDESTGVLYAVVEVQEPYQQKNNRPPLLANLFVQADIAGKAVDNIFALPLSAINASQEVLLVDNQQKLHIRRVEVLRNEDDRILVKAGLNAGDQLVTSGVDVPVEGMTVKIAADKTGANSPTAAQ